MHPEGKKWITENEAAYAKKYGLTVEQARNELTTQANLQVQNGSSGTWNQRANDFLSQAHGMLPSDGSSGPGYMFYTAPEQKANVEMYAKYYPGGVGTNVPSGSAIASSTSREQTYRDAYAKGTIGAAAGAAVIVVGGPIAALPGAPIFSSGGALGSGALASSVGTGAISAGINAGAQYVQNGKINLIDVAGAFGTGAAGSYDGLLWNVGVNAIGGATTTALNNILQGKNDSVIVAGATGGLFSSLGYGIGKVGESWVTNSLKPTINTTNWSASGTWSVNGWNIFRPHNAAVAIGAAAGGVGQEISGSAAQHLPTSNGQKK
ncbi:hypothetical protein [Burkholderia cepacia]|uniref:hypothetical protein n=1 Tax=Burkholderia cepacia TaxID=292 RepID=UPI0009BA8B9A|nr:hypothetical protein [Burkholderia cepacia]